MRAHLILLCGALMWSGLFFSGCDDPQTNGPDASTPEDSGTDGGPRDGGGQPPPPPVDGGQDGGSYVSDFTCDVSLQQGCEAGASCLYTDLRDGGTGSTCFPGACDVVSQNCPNGQRCTYVLANGTRGRMCVADGTANEGDPCSLASGSGAQTFDTCKKGLYCTDTVEGDGGTTFRCQRFCHGNAQCGASLECNEVLRLSGTGELPLACGAPSPKCDVLAQDCAAPLGCYPSETPGAAVCTGIGPRAEGAACDFSNQCAKGSACVGPASARVCRTLCRTPSGTPACPSGRTCQGLADYPGVGACVP